MPGLVKLLVFLLVLGGIAGGSIFGLATFVDPEPKEKVIRLKIGNLN